MYLNAFLIFLVLGASVCSEEWLLWTIMLWLNMQPNQIKQGIMYNTIKVIYISCFIVYLISCLLILWKLGISMKKKRVMISFIGEDRWLCTLLLQRGYRVEYSAASDAYTNAPEGFSELYNQRRRWVPSTMANIMDLLQDYKRTVQINDNISLPYIFYQVNCIIVL